MHFPFKILYSFLYFEKKNHFKNGLELPLILFYFKRENNIFFFKRKTLKVTSDKKNVSLEKPSLNSKIMLPIEKIR